MKTKILHWSPEVAVLGLLMGAAPSFADTLQVKKVEFIAVTNVKMFKFTGAATNFSAELKRKGNELTSVEIRIPVSELKTGMEIRDKHMRERVFTGPNESLPDVVFKGEKSACHAVDGAQSCTISGQLSIRGEQHPYQFPLTLKDGKSIIGDATVDVLAFGVKPEALTYSKIVVDKNVQIHFEADIQ